MKKLPPLALMIFFLFASNEVCAQLGNLEKRIENKVKRRLDQKADKAIDKVLDKTEKGAEDAVKGDKTSNKKEARTPQEDTETSSTSSQKKEVTEKSTDSNSQPFRAYSKFDFVPGNKITFFDDYTVDNPGDFPLKWNTNGSGQIATTEDGTKWLDLKGNSVYIPEFTSQLPENYTIEFDINTSELDNKLSSTAQLSLILDDNKTFNNGRNMVKITLPFTQYVISGVQVQNRVNGQEIISNRISEDIRKQMNNGAHVSIAVNKRRLRLWIDEVKIIDIPTLVPASIQQFKLFMQGFSEDFKNFNFYLSNLKVAEADIDLRSKLLTEGKFVTSGILFDVNSDKIKPESYGVLKEIAQVLRETESIRVKIVGHTDADGNEQSNLELSKRRALSVKAVLNQEFAISESRMEYDGKGETEPIDNNSTSEGKAHNRRVEFVKL